MTELWKEDISPRPRGCEGHTRLRRGRRRCCCCWRPARRRWRWPRAAAPSAPMSEDEQRKQARARTLPPLAPMHTRSLGRAVTLQELTLRIE